MRRLQVILDKVNMILWRLQRKIGRGSPSDSSSGDRWRSFLKTDVCELTDSYQSSNQVAVLRVPSQHHCEDVLIFQTQPYSLYR